MSTEVQTWTVPNISKERKHKMAKPISEDDTVLCRLYNTPEGKFYGENFTATVKQVTQVKGWSSKSYLVSRDGLPDIWIRREEIKRRL